MFVRVEAAKISGRASSGGGKSAELLILGEATTFLFSINGSAGDNSVGREPDREPWPVVTTELTVPLITADGEDFDGKWLASRRFVRIGHAHWNVATIPTTINETTAVWQMSIAMSGTIIAARISVTSSVVTTMGFRNQDTMDQRMERSKSVDPTSNHSQYLGITSMLASSVLLCGVMIEETT